LTAIFRQGRLNALALFAADPLYHHGMAAGYAAVREGRSLLVQRKEYIDDQEWYRSKSYEATTRLMGFDDEMVGMFPIGTGPADMQCLIIYRDKMKRRFNEAEQQRLKLLMDTVRPLIGGPLAGFREVGPSELPPRVREVLACALEGDSDKQVAQRLNISPNTVHQYMRQIYRRFNVAGRSELLARWVRRGWSAKCAWRDGELPVVELRAS
jgi:DNA-binding CsgD family transcriptional regulator